MLFLGLLALSLLSCSGEDIKPYLRDADGVFRAFNSDSLALGGQVSGLPPLGNEAFFDRARTAFAEAGQASRKHAESWDALKVPGTVKPFHERTARFLDSVSGFYDQLAEATRTRSWEKVLLAMGPLGDISDEHAALNGEWVKLAKKADLDATAAQRVVDASSAEQSEVRRYVLRMLPPFGAMLDMLKELARFPSSSTAGTSRPVFFQSRESFGGRGVEAIAKTQSAVAALNPPTSASATHRSIVSMVDGLGVLYSGIQAASQSQTFGALAEAYLPMSALYTSMREGDCAWRAVVSQAFQTTQGSQRCGAADSQTVLDIDYAVGVYIIYANLVDVFVETTQSPPATLRAFAGIDKRAAMRALADARKLKPPAARAQFQATFEAYLADLAGAAEELEAASFRTGVDRYIVPLARMNEMLRGRFETLNQDVASVWSSALASLTP